MPPDSSLPPEQFNKVLNDALKRVQRPELFKHTVFLLDKHPHRDDYWQWLSSAPEAEILEWIAAEKTKG